MKASTFLTVITLSVLLIGVAGLADVAAQCGTTVGCGDANCSMCASTVSDKSSSCSDPTLTLALNDLTADELKLVNHLADLVEKNKRVEFDVPAFSKATGLSEETILAMDEQRIQAGLFAVLDSRGFDTSKLAMSSGGTCAEFGACSVEANLMGASGDVLNSYQAEKNSDGKSYVAWKAPDFTLPTTDGKEITLSDYRGKPVALAILATHCNHCIDTMPMLAKLGEKYGNDLVILPVVTNARSMEAAKSWAKALGIDYPLIVSTDKKVSESYKAQLVPTVVLINSKGYVTKKLVTFQDQSKLDGAFAELVKASGSSPAKGSK